MDSMGRASGGSLRRLADEAGRACVHEFSVRKSKAAEICARSGLSPAEFARCIGVAKGRCVLSSRNMPSRRECAPTCQHAGFSARNPQRCVWPSSRVACYPLSLTAQPLEWGSCDPVGSKRNLETRRRRDSQFQPRSIFSTSAMALRQECAVPE